MPWLCFATMIGCISIVSAAGYAAWRLVLVMIRQAEERSKGER